MSTLFCIHYKHDQYGSDQLGVDCKTLDDAIDLVLAIQKDPGKAGGWSDWLKDACLWVTDCNGNIYWS